MNKIKIKQDLTTHKLNIFTILGITQSDKYFILSEDHSTQSVDSLAN